MTAPKFITSGYDNEYVVMEAGAWERHCNEANRLALTYRDRWARYNPLRRFKLWLWYNGWINRLNLRDPQNPEFPITWFRTRKPK